MNRTDQLLLIPLVTGVIFMAAGFVLLKFPPKKINWFYGYRTPRSMKNQKRWDFAQNYSAREMIKLGGLLLLSSSLGFIHDFDERESGLIGITLVLIAVAALFVRTERALKKH